MSAIPCVLLASILWAIATQIFSYLGKCMPVRRLNYYKSLISLIAFVVLCLLTNNLIPPEGTVKYLLASGFFGFALGDLCIFYAFAKMGSARTLMISAFGPGIIMIQSILFLGSPFHPMILVGIFFIFICIFFLSLDKLEGIDFRWKYAFVALIGFTLDATGIVISKQAFELSPELSSSTANTYRILVAVILLAAVNLSQGIPLSTKDLGRKTIGLLLISSLTGTFLALLLWMQAIKNGDPTVIAALGSLTPVYSAIYDYSIRKIWPSRYFFIALLCMGIGAAILIRQENLPT